MGWFNRKKKKPEELEDKLNPAQPYIQRAEGDIIYSREPVVTYQRQYESIEIVNRAVNMIVDDAAEIPCTIGNSIPSSVPVTTGIRKATVNRLMNTEPNPFQDINTFKRNLFIDFIIDGNIFVYFDGAHLYHLPANKVTIHTDEKTYISHYEYNGLITYYPNEIIHVKENSFFSIYRGNSRLRSADRTMKLLTSLRSFQDNFFKNGAVPGLVLKTPNTLSEKIKERLLASWQQKYRPDAGGRRPLILDGGLEVDSISNVNFKELDFQNSIIENEKTLLKALGIPPILLDGGNNANIRPNHRLYYLETVLPIVRKVNFAFARYFGFEIWENITDTPALQPELSEQASYFATLVNGGILSANEAREALGLDPMPGNDEIRVPANVAGSATNPSEGGRPAGNDNE
jgi:HK97 family phage portal protein